VRIIAHLSDLHFGRHDETAAERLLADISQTKPDIVVVTGDLTQRARHRQFATAREFLQRLPRPVLVIPGNHDVPLYDIIERFVGRLARYRQYICAELQPFFADDEIALLGLNTARSAAFSNGRISYRQAAAIKSTFAEVPANRWRILAIHHPLAVPVAARDLAPVGRSKMARKAMIEGGAPAGAVRALPPRLLRRSALQRPRKRWFDPVRPSRNRNLYPPSRRTQFLQPAPHRADRRDLHGPQLHRQGLRRCRDRALLATRRPVDAALAYQAGAGEGIESPSEAWESDLEVVKSLNILYPSFDFSVLEFRGGS
jgi:hypothetical protein